jgi:hypothetical protein
VLVCVLSNFFTPRKQVNYGITIYPAEIPAIALTGTGDASITMFNTPTQSKDGRDATGLAPPVLAFFPEIDKEKGLEPLRIPALLRRRKGGVIISRRN